MSIEYILKYIFHPLLAKDLFHFLDHQQFYLMFTFIHRIKHQKHSSKQCPQYLVCNLSPVHLSENLSKWGKGGNLTFHFYEVMRLFRNEKDALWEMA